MNQNKKPPFREDICGALVTMLCTTPKSQLSPELRGEVEKYFSIERKLPEAYDFIDRISQFPKTEASQFVKNACSLSQFYERPAS